MDWTQIALALIVGLPGILAAVGSFINTIHLMRIKEQNVDLKAQVKGEATAIKDENAVQTTKLNTIRNETERLHDENVAKGEKLDTIKTTTEKIAKAVNGDLDARFKTIEGKIDMLVDAMMAAKLLAENPSRPIRERG